MSAHPTNTIPSAPGAFNPKSKIGPVEMLTPPDTTHNSPTHSAEYLPLPPSMKQKQSKEHLDTFSASLRRIAKLVGGEAVVADGQTLSIADVYAAAVLGTDVTISNAPEVLKRVDDSVTFLQSKLGESIYGVSTGFGGSADTRTNDLMGLQQALLEHQMGGVIPTSISGDEAIFQDTAFPFTPDSAKVMPEAIVRGAILVRINSLLRGHSAVRMEVLQALCSLLVKRITPLVPLRGSISASGDLSPLSYVAATVCAHPSMKVIDRSSGKPEILSASAALQKHGIKPIVLGPKEGLGIMNGTAFSASAGSLVVHEAHFLASLTQVLTAMTVEALVGMAGSFDPFIHDVTRPHSGQIEAASNIFGMLSSSKLSVNEEEDEEIEASIGVLRQDRYALRTSAQWIGPQLEDLVAAHKSIDVEVNSTTDNPLVDVEGGKVHHGGNFQAMAVTNAVEKTRLALANIGKIAFAQVNELINCTMNRGLPANLSGDEPSTNYHCKGLDIHAAAYIAEIGYLANPVVTHVHSAEMHNQSVNSLALISARKTSETADVLTMLLSVQLYVVCQALDLRAIDVTFRRDLHNIISDAIKTNFPSCTAEEALQATEKLHSLFVRSFESKGNLDTDERCRASADVATMYLLDSPALKSALNSGDGLTKFGTFRSSLTKSTADRIRAIRDSFFSGSTDAEKIIPTDSVMGKTKELYRFVRNDLGIKARRGDVKEGKMTTNIGTYVSKIYEALRSSKGKEVVAACF